MLRIYFEGDENATITMCADDTTCQSSYIWTDKGPVAHHLEVIGPLKDKKTVYFMVESTTD